MILLAATPVFGLAAAEAGLFDGAIQRIASAKLHRPVRFSHLSLDLFSIRPTATVRDLVIASPQAVTRDDLLHAPLVRMRLRLFPLLLGRLRPLELTLSHPSLNLVSLGPGRNNYGFMTGGEGGMFSQIRRFVISGGLVHCHAAQGHSLEATFEQTAETGRPLPFHLRGHGVVAGEPVTVEAFGGALNGRSKGAFYPQHIHLVDGASVVDLVGVTAKPFDFSRFRFRAHASGPNLADLHYLFGLRTPNSPPFQGSAQIWRENALSRFTDVRGRVGRSDLEGSAFADRGVRPIRLRLRLRSKLLYLEDLRPALKPPPPHALARSQPGADAPAGAGGRQKLDTQLRLQAFKGVDLAVDLQADRVVGGVAPVEDVTVRILSSPRRLAVQPLSFTLSGGRGKLAATLDLDGSIPTLRFAATLERIPLRALHPGLGRTADALLDAKFAATGAGRSAREILRRSTGRGSVILRDGTFTRSKAAALSGDLVRAIGLSLGDRGAKTPLVCGVAEFNDLNGVLRAQRLVLVTGAGYASGSGQLDLANQTVDLTFSGAPAQRRPLQLDAPVGVTGPLQRPVVKVRTGEAIRKAGAKGVIALAISPVAGLLPSSPSWVPQPDCRSLTTEAANYVR